MSEVYWTSSCFQRFQKLWAVAFNFNFCINILMVCFMFIYYVLPLLHVYIYGDAIIKKRDEDRDLTSRFYPATFVYLFQDRTWIIIVRCHVFPLCSMIYGEMYLTFFLQVNIIFAMLLKNTTNNETWYVDMSIYVVFIRTVLQCKYSLYIYLRGKFTEKYTIYITMTNIKYFFIYSFI